MSRDVKQMLAEEAAVAEDYGDVDLTRYVRSRSSKAGAIHTVMYALLTELPGRIDEDQAYRAAVAAVEALAAKKRTSST